MEPVFGTGREIGLGTVTDPDFDAGGKPGDSARRYLQPDDPYYKYADMLYAWKIARHCNGEPYCLEVGIPKDIDGVPYNNYCTPQIDLDIDPDQAVLGVRRVRSVSKLHGACHRSLSRQQRAGVGPGDLFRPVFQRAVKLPGIPRSPADSPSWCRGGGNAFAAVSSL